MTRTAPTTTPPDAQAILVLPHLRIQNANSIASALTHGFPSITAFTGLMWALERKLTKAGIPLKFEAVGVVCHSYQKQVNGAGRLYAPYQFNLAKPMVRTKEQAKKLEDGTPPAFIEEGRMHLDITLVFAIAEKDRPTGAAPTLVQGNEAQLAEWASAAGNMLAAMRVAGGSILPTRPVPGKRVRPWIAIVPEEPEAADRAFTQWRRQWLPGFALVGRDDVLHQRLTHLRDTTQPDATLLDAWLDASRFNYQSQTDAEGKLYWGDPQRNKGSGWIVPIPVGYAALTPQHPAGSVLNVRDTSVPLRFVEPVHSLGEWVSPHRLHSLSALLWYAHTDSALGLYRCCNYYQQPENLEGDDEAYEYT